MIDWTEISPFEPLPTVEVLATNGKGVYLTGQLERISLSRIYCRGDKEELDGITHYSVLNPPKSKGKMSVILSEPKPEKTDWLSAYKPQIEEKPKEPIVSKIDWDKIPTNTYLQDLKIQKTDELEFIEPVFIKNSRRKSGNNRTYWNIFISKVRQIPIGIEFHYLDIKIEDFDPYKERPYWSMLKKLGYIERYGHCRFKILKEIPEGIMCNGKLKKKSTNAGNQNNSSELSKQAEGKTNG